MLTMPERLQQQLGFIVEIDRLKTVLRQTVLMDSSRRENSAEHSWHLAMMALVLAEYADTPTDPLHVVRLVLIHDLVEIDAGDTFGYDLVGQASQPEREQRAAERLFGLLPADQGAALMGWWHEFEARETPEARFANLIDRLQPLLHNFATQGGTWRKHQITRAQVMRRMQPIADASQPLWRYVVQVIDESVARGYLLP